MKRATFPRPVLLLVLAVLLACCVAVVPRTDANAIAVTGTVRHFDIEGGFFAIRGDDGITYDPVSLDRRFRIDGLRVRMVALIRNDLSGFHMVGPIVEIRRIEIE